MARFYRIGGSDTQLKLKHILLISIDLNKAKTALDHSNRAKEEFYKSEVYLGKTRPEFIVKAEARLDTVKGYKLCFPPTQSIVHLVAAGWCDYVVRCSVRWSRGPIWISSAHSSVSVCSRYFGYIPYILV